MSLRLYFPPQLKKAIKHFHVLVLYKFFWSVFAGRVAFFSLRRPLMDREEFVAKSLLFSQLFQFRRSVCELTAFANSAQSTGD